MANVRVGKHTSLLLMGPATGNNYRKEIVFGSSYDNVYNTFGDSELTKAYKIVYDLGVRDIFLMNCRQQYDYLEVGETLKATDFAYVVPLSISLSDEFDDPKTERRISYLEYLLESIGRTNNSTFIITDKSASLYEDIDLFIDDMNAVAKNFGRKIRYPANKENIIFVANNLVNYELASLPLAAALCVTPINKYPDIRFGPAYFEIDQYEDIGNWAYFQNHTVRSTTVENLLNFLETGNVLKIVFVSRIIKMIRKELDFSDFIGKKYTEYRRLCVEQYLDTYLSKLLGDYLERYDILSVRAFRDPEPMSIDIDNIFNVYPINCLEKVTISKTIEVA